MFVFPYIAREGGREREGGKFGNESENVEEMFSNSHSRHHLAKVCTFSEFQAFTGFSANVPFIHTKTKRRFQIFIYY